MAFDHTLLINLLVHFHFCCFYFIVHFAFLSSRCFSYKANEIGYYCIDLHLKYSFRNIIYFVFNFFWQCSVTCGHGMKRRYVSCRYRGGAVAPVNECDAGKQPKSSTGCNDRPCPEWFVGEWSKVSDISKLIIVVICLL